MKPILFGVLIPIRLQKYVLGGCSTPPELGPDRRYHRFESLFILPVRAYSDLHNVAFRQERSQIDGVCLFLTSCALRRAVSRPSSMNWRACRANATLSSQRFRQIAVFNDKSLSTIAVEKDSNVT